MTVLRHTAVTGQSLAEGAFSEPVSPTESAFPNCHRVASDGSLTALTTGSDQAPDRTIAERAYSSPGPNLTVHTSALGGTAYTGLKKGTATYAALVARIEAGYDAAVTRGDEFTVGAMHVIHGEANSGTDRSVYENYLYEWRGDLDADTVAITGQAAGLPLIVSQVSSGGYGSGAAMGQMDAHRNSPLVTLVGPQYQFPMTDSLHLTGTGYYRLGEMHGMAQAAVVAGGRWEPCSPTSITVDGNDIIIECHVPEPPLVIDTDIVTSQTRYGFTVTDGGVNRNITGYSVDGTTIVLTMQLTPSSSALVRYSKGNIRDSASAVSALDDAPLHNWLCLFDEQVGFTYTPTPAAAATLVDVNGGPVVQYQLVDGSPVEFTDAVLS